MIPASVSLPYSSRGKGCSRSQRCDVRRDLALRDLGGKSSDLPLLVAEFELRPLRLKHRSEILLSRLMFVNYGSSPETVV